MSVSPKKWFRLIPAITAIVAGMVAAPPAHSAENPYERGPAPTEASVTAERGPFAIAQITVPASSVRGFGGGTIYYPTSTSEGTFGAVAVAPGFTETESDIRWYGPRLASQGFVVMTFATNSIFDQPASRADQLQAALDYITGSSSVRDRIDAARLGVMGHSMGGGGAIEATNERRALQASIPLTPWHNTKNWSRVTTPTLIIGAENDVIASPGSHAEPFYDGMSSAQEKAYLELNNAGHSAPLSSNTTIAKYSISWLKRFIDDDTRYDQFLCPPPRATGAISEYRDTCPNG